MGGIGCVTPYSRRSRPTIKRSTKLVKTNVTGEFGKVAIKAYKKPFVSALSCIKVSSLFPDELNPRSQKLSFALDQLWMASMTLPDANLDAPSPSWGRFMQLASKGENYERTRIEILNKPQLYLHCLEFCQGTKRDGVMRKTNKNIFGQLLKSQTEAIDHYPVNSTFIVDGDGQTVIVIGNDTDLLVMMVALATPSMHVYLCDTTKGPRVFSISHREKQRRNVELSSSLYAEKPETPKAETENVREFLLKLYGSNKLGSTLDKLRHYKYKQAIEKSSLTSTIKLECLPPTSAAAAQHSLRAYHQVQTWCGKRVDATAWGWQIGGGILAPVETTKGVVPENLLKMVACSCKTQCMKARLMLAALSWNALQRSNATEKVDVVKWSKRKGAWVLEERRKKQASDSVPPQLKSLMSRVVEVASQHLQLPPIAEPKLQRRGCHVAKPSKEELRHL
ncbi:hypothetical protein CAPTEDRAFT_216478 [Capitella teleta]|uniref:Uncharacterized protein n=1 Tax=Capitella teleta TaxID=283909 RepID=R7TK85_CAPTE|nr:hypothetical protein CAPTEDRAFT_216478 [Capitella teleta]|eukprot:ELT91946.1 hypothetical protein CAPTEDRAFT_216478 [Capitella teleta]